MGEVILRTKNLSKIYSHNKVVDSVNLEIKQGEIYGLVGKNGAGKTTLMRIVTGLADKSSGEIELFSETTEGGLNNARQRTGCIIETPCFYPYLSAKKNLEYYRLQRGIVGSSSVDEALNLVGLNDVGNKKFKNFSLGMKQRLGLALALMSSPDLLVLDEPINGLDPMGIAEFREIILKLNQERNITILISSHILGELSQIATCYGFINDGKLVEQISAEEIEEKCKQFLSIKVDNPKKACVILEKEFNFTHYEVLNNNEIRIFKDIDSPELINRAFVTNDILVYSLNQVGINLENYFIDLIGGKEHA